MGGKTFDPTRLALFDGMIRQGQGAVVRAEIRELKGSKIPREFMADLANTARRVGLPSLALRFLHPLRRAELDFGDAMSAKEKASYAASLAAIGAHQEAHALLRPLAEDRTPEAQLYLGYVCMYKWEYRSAITHLTTYEGLPGLTDYQRFIAKLNLASAYSFERETERLIALASELAVVGTQQGWKLLARDAHMLATQGFIQAGDFAKARAMLDAGFELARENALDAFLLRKWQVVMALHESPASEAASAELAAFRKEAVEARDFESLRECDYYLGMLTRNSRLLQKVYFGTPYPDYRRRILKEARGWLELPAAYTWAVKGQHGRLVDLESGDFSGQKLGSALVLNVIRALSRDFYRPMRLATLFGELYPDEHFDPLSSPGRTRRAVGRAREWLEECGSALSIESRANTYQLTSAEPLDLRVRIEYGESDQQVDPQLIKKLRKQFPYKAFSAKQAAEHLKLPLSSARGALKDAAEAGAVFRIGTGRSTLFRFAK